MHATLCKHRAANYSGNQTTILLRFAKELQMRQGKPLPAIKLTIDDTDYDNLLDAMPGMTRAQRHDALDALLNVLCGRLNTPVDNELSSPRHIRRKARG
jgi:hypothetical protein